MRVRVGRYQDAEHPGDDRGYDDGVVGGCEHRRGYGDDRLLRATPCTEALKLETIMRLRDISIASRTMPEPWRIEENTLPAPRMRRSMVRGTA